MVLDGGVEAWKEAGYGIIRPEAGPDAPPKKQKRKEEADTREKSAKASER